MSELLTMLSTGGLSGIFGLAGGILNRVVDHKTTVAKLKFKEKEMQARENELRIEGELNLKLQQSQSETDIERDVIAAGREADQTASADYRAALESDKAAYWKKGAPKMLAVVDFLRGTVRIVCIYILLAMSGWIIYNLNLLDAVNDLTIKQRYDLMMHVVTTILSMTTLGLAFYFGNRPSGGHKA